MSEEKCGCGGKCRHCYGFYPSIVQHEDNCRQNPDSLQNRGTMASFAPRHVYERIKGMSDPDLAKHICNVCKWTVDLEQPNPVLLAGATPENWEAYSLYSLDMIQRACSEVFGIRENAGKFLDALTVIVAQDQRSLTIHPKDALEYVGVFPIVNATARQRILAFCVATKDLK